MLNDDEKAVLKQSWADALPASGAVADLFFERLLALRPTYAALFLSADLRARKVQLVHAIDFVVRSLDWPEPAWMDAVSTNEDAVFSAFSVAEDGYGLSGITPEAFPLLGEALVWALESVLGPRWDASSRGVWTRVAATLVTALRLGAARAEALAPPTRRQIDSAADEPTDTERFPRSYFEGAAPFSLGPSRRIVSS
jgi:hemoglobin-like flavoprotein